ncbi:alkaline phosphatase D family protein [Pontibacter arcticus]|uniref:Alkaline phosphatase family protein n=1 Tax=Pontibacter arcticus TaxID=2080288 RepID=A0A364RBY2_9BACT|nr:alkaline phosphatase D family protein [Pontibacter arcticus]RAU81850.1 alkaline phosphatase family protein [Pontibacter arcticus]
MIKYLLSSLVVMFTLDAAVAQKQAEFVMAFGSCNRQNLPQPMWDVIAKEQPNLWIWLGDNIYGDTDDMAVLKAKYDVQANQEGYKKLASSVPVIGTWDDHDYGRNDAGKEYPYRKESQALALDFFNEPANSPRRKQEGIYAAYDYKLKNKTVKVILLDIRYHQDALQKDSTKAYLPNMEGDLLGEAQWKWLEKQLKDSKADAHIIGSGIQFIPDQHPYEKWANFPNTRNRLFNLLAKTKPKGVMLISGDRHIGEFSKMEVKGLSYPVYEITSSGLTHSATNNTSEVNPYRVGPLVNQKHFGVFTFKENGKSFSVELELKGENGEPFHTENIVLAK